MIPAVDQNAFDANKQAAQYDHWFRAQVTNSIEDGQPSLPHDQLMAELESIICETEHKQRESALTGR